MSEKTGPAPRRMSWGFLYQAAPVLIFAAIMWSAAVVFSYSLLTAVRGGSLDSFLASHPLVPLWAAGSALLAIALTAVLVRGYRQYRFS